MHLATRRIAAPSRAVHRREARRIPPRNAPATRADRAGPPMPSSASCVLQPADRRANDLVESGKLLLQIPPAGRGDAIRLPAILRFHGTNPAALLEPGDRAVECSRTETHAGEALDVFHHGVAV